MTLLKVLISFMLFFCSESWTNESSLLDLNFCKPIYKHRKRKKSGKRDSGGLCCYFKPEIKDGVTEIDWAFEDGLLFKFNKNFFGWERDAYLFCIYMRDSRSTREDLNDGLNCYEIVLDQMARVPIDADIFAMGDWNARVGNRSEFTFENVCDIERLNNPVSDFEERNNENFISEDDLLQNNMLVTRCNKDDKINEYGLKQEIERM